MDFEIGGQRPGPIKARGGPLDEPMRAAPAALVRGAGCKRARCVASHDLAVLGGIRQRQIFAPEPPPDFVLRHRIVDRLPAQDRFSKGAQVLHVGRIDLKAHATFQDLAFFRPQGFRLRECPPGEIRHRAARANANKRRARLFPRIQAEALDPLPCRLGGGVHLGGEIGEAYLQIGRTGREGRAGWRVQFVEISALKQVISDAAHIPAALGQGDAAAPARGVRVHFSGLPVEKRRQRAAAGDDQFRAQHRQVSLGREPAVATRAVVQQSILDESAFVVDPDLAARGRVDGVHEDSFVGPQPRGKVDGPIGQHRAASRGPA